MHELGITKNIVAIVSENAKGIPVRKVTLEIGKLSAVMPDAIRFCFDVCCKGTVLEGATLEIIEIPGVASCCRCDAKIDLEQPFGICDNCGSSKLKILQGEELKIKSMEIYELCA